MLTLKVYDPSHFFDESRSYFRLAADGLKPGVSFKCRSHKQFPGMNADKSGPHRLSA
jgi:hypothetical protein